MSEKPEMIVVRAYPARGPVDSPMEGRGVTRCDAEVELVQGTYFLGPDLYSGPTVPIPTEIIQKAHEVARWFELRGITDWKLAGVQARK